MRHNQNERTDKTLRLKQCQTSSRNNWMIDTEDSASLHTGCTQSATASTLETGSCCASPSALSCCCWHGSGCTGSSLAQSEYWTPSDPLSTVSSVHCFLSPLIINVIFFIVISYLPLSLSVSHAFMDSFKHYHHMFMTLLVWYTAAVVLQLAGFFLDYY